MRRAALIFVMVVGMAGSAGAQAPPTSPANERWCQNIKNQRDQYEFFMAKAQMEIEALKAELELAKKSTPAKPEKKDK